MGGPAVSRVRLQENRELALPAKLPVPDLPLYRSHDFTDLHCVIYYLLDIIYFSATLKLRTEQQSIYAVQWYNCIAQREMRQMKNYAVKIYERDVEKYETTIQTENIHDDSGISSAMRLGLHTHATR